MAELPGKGKMKQKERDKIWAEKMLKKTLSRERYIELRNPSAHDLDLFDKMVEELTKIAAGEKSFQRGIKIITKNGISKTEVF